MTDETRPTRSYEYRLLPALFAIALGVLFLLDLDRGRWWPLFVILGGLSMLARGDRPRSLRQQGGC